MKFSSIFNTSVQRSYIFYFKIGTLILSPFFWKLSSENYLNSQVRINKMVNKHTVDYHPSSSQLTSRIYPLRFLCTPRGFIFSESFLNFFLNLYIPPWLWKSFKVIVLRLLQYICESKNWICSFLIMHPRKTLPQVFIIILQADGNCPFLPNSVFWRYFFLRRKGGEDYGVERITKINKGIGHKFW